MMTVTLHAFIFYLIFFLFQSWRKRCEWLCVHPCRNLLKILYRLLHKSESFYHCSYLIAVKSSCLIDIYIMWKLIKNKELMKYFFRNVLINEQWRCVNVCFVADFFLKSSVSLFKAVCKVIWPRFGSGFGILTDFI